MRLQPPDQLSILLIWVSAIFMAVKQGIESWPAARLALPQVSAGWLSLVPLVLLVIAAMVSLLRGPSATFNAELATDTWAGRYPLGAEGRSDLLPKAVSDAFTKLLRSEHTQLQRDAFLQQYTGKRICLNAVLSGLTKSGTQLKAQMYIERIAAVPSFLHVAFDEKWENHIAHLKPETSISFCATIAKTKSGSFGLFDGEPF